MFLTKSDLKACGDCRTKLYYRKSHNYPSANDENEYLRFLADGGFMVEFIAKLRFPGGVDLAEVRDSTEATRQTSVLLAQPEAVIFEAGAIHGKFHVRTDILRKRGRELELIEVKSSAIDDDEDDVGSPFITTKGGIHSRWKKYITDIAFQAHVLQLAYPDLEVKPFLCVVDKSHVATETETLQRFRLRKDRQNPKARPEVSYEGDPAELADTSLLAVRSVKAEIRIVMAEVVAQAERLATQIADGNVAHIQEDISIRYAECRKCEYRGAGQPDGFEQCWGPLATVRPHILDLFRVSQLPGKADPVAKLLAEREASMLALREDQFGDSSFGARRRMQWRAMRDGIVEHLPNSLLDALRAHQTAPGWPLHFIDFEACDVSLPHHAGLRPYERVAFQWSCHTVTADGTVTHAEWLNATGELPNFAFARLLRKRIGNAGTVYVWSGYEQTTLRKVIEQIREWVQRDAATAVRLSGAANAEELHTVADWIEGLLGPEAGTGTKRKRISPRIRDLHELAMTHYFHQGMRGQTSIKVVLPSVWSSDDRLRAMPCFTKYASATKDPYQALPCLPFDDKDDEDNAVREGTGAIRVYQDLVFDADATAEHRENRRLLLLQYCELDTAAMVMIWAHWLGRYDLHE